MKARSFMVIAGDASGDLLAAELVSALREQVVAASRSESSDLQPLRAALAPTFFGAGGSNMAEAGVEVVCDLARHSVIGYGDVFKNILKFYQSFQNLRRLAIARQPDVIIGVDFGGFNLRFAKTIRKYLRAHTGPFQSWKPKLVQYVSPQVWASRPGRAYELAENHDLILSIFPFERQWYGQRVPRLPVKFVGHPMIERYRRLTTAVPPKTANRTPLILLLPGSRSSEIARHWPVLVAAAQQIAAANPANFQVVVPRADLAAAIESDPVTQSTRAKLQLAGLQMNVQVGALTTALAATDLAITKSGTITMECAFFGVPAVVFYKTSWPTYQIAKQLVNVKSLAMPNLLAGAEVYPEFLQYEATPENLAAAALKLLRDEPHRRKVQAQLAAVIASLGGAGAATRAATAILQLRS